MTVPNSIAATLVSIQVGLPWSYGSDEAIDAHDKAWTSGIYKSGVRGPVFAGTTNLHGDGQADLKHHGGVDKAVLAYSADHYPEWRERLGISDMPYGGFGENLTIAGWSEDNVCIGDFCRIGRVIFEVSQPRQPCWKLARRWRIHELLGMVVRNGWAGWYLRVKEEGLIEAGMPVELIERPNPEWTIARANQILHHCPTDLELTLALAEVPRLANAWVQELKQRADRLREAAVSSQLSEV
jgi:MOSC domain-containing protein YiiM